MTSKELSELYEEIMCTIEDKTGEQLAASRDIKYAVLQLVENIEKVLKGDK